MKIFRLREWLADQAGSDNLSIDGDQAALRLLWKNDLRDAGHHHRIDDAGENRENNRQAQSGSKFFEHDLTPLREMQCDQDLVDQPNSGKWHDDPTQAINKQVARQHLACTDW